MQSVCFQARGVVREEAYADDGIGNDPACFCFNGDKAFVVRLIMEKRMQGCAVKPMGSEAIPGLLAQSGEVMLQKMQICHLKPSQDDACSRYVR
jgi:hypothetical protein